MFPLRNNIEFGRWNWVWLKKITARQQQCELAPSSHNTRSFSPYYYTITRNILPGTFTPSDELPSDELPPGKGWEQPTHTHTHVVDARFFVHPHDFYYTPCSRLAPWFQTPTTWSHPDLSPLNSTWKMELAARRAHSAPWSHATVLTLNTKI